MSLENEIEMLIFKDNIKLDNSNLNTCMSQNVDVDRGSFHKMKL